MAFRAFLIRNIDYKIKHFLILYSSLKIENKYGKIKKDISRGGT